MRPARAAGRAATEITNNVRCLNDGARKSEPALNVRSARGHSLPNTNRGRVHSSPAALGSDASICLQSATARESGMTKSIGYVVVCLLGLAGCSFERYDDCDTDYDHQDDDDGGSGARAGSKGSGIAGSRTNPE